MITSPLAPRCLALACTAFAVASLGSRIFAAEPAAKPNIILILADDLGYGEVSFNGQRRYTTPNIDRIAAEGMVFANAYAGSAICAPSRNCLMTGDHTGHATVRNNFAGGGNEGDRVALKPSDITIAQRLRDQGYATGMVGKWGLGEPETAAAPWRRGWEFFYGFVNQAHAHNQYPEFLYRDAVTEPQAENFGHKEGVFANDSFTREGLAFIQRSAAARKPFFAFFSYTTPHADLKCPAESIEEVKALYPWAREPGAKESSIIFAAMMHRLDRDVGRILAKVHELGLDENTLIIFTGDNGAHQEDGKDNAFFNASGPFRGIKRDLYEGGIREPFFARWTGRIAPGSRSDHLMAFWDFPATALELAGAARPGDLPPDGISYAPSLLGRSNAQAQHDYLYWELQIKGEGRQALRAGRWKAVRNGLHNPVELYDLDSDPGEKTDLAAQQPELVGRYTALLQSARVENPDFPLAAPKGGKAKATAPGESAPAKSKGKGKSKS
jgi:arylsulfatase A